MPRVTSREDYVAARVSPDLKARFAEIARREHRSISGELRRLMAERVSQADATAGRSA